MTPLSVSIHKDLTLSLHGYSGIADLDNWAGTGKRLMDKMWKEVRALQLPNKGLNVWVYEEGSHMFAGVELMTSPPPESTLEQKTVTLPRYAYHKHRGPYDAIVSTYAAAREELKKVGIQPILPYVEIYGHHHDDPAQQETELLWSIK
jgi:hypothetical protein